MQAYHIPRFCDGKVFIHPPEASVHRRSAHYSYITEKLYRPVSYKKTHVLLKKFNRAKNHYSEKKVTNPYRSLKFKGSVKKKSKLQAGTKNIPKLFFWISYCKDK